MSQGMPEGTFVTIMEFPPLRPGAEPAFLEWFRKTSLVYTRHPGFLARYLLKPEKEGETYRMLVLHKSRATFTHICII